jgi:hypothetical protein
MSTHEVKNAQPRNDRSTTRRNAAFMVALFCLAQIGMLYLQRGGTRQGARDFTDFYVGGRIVAEGNGRRLYDVALQEQTEKEALGRSDNHFLAPFVHPPFFALWMAVPAKLPYLVAYYLWFACNQCFLWMALFLLGRSLHRSALRPERIVCAVLLFFPVTVAFLQGQDSLLSLFLASLAYWFLNRRSAALAGAAVGLGCFKPQLALLILVLLVLTWRDKRRIAAGFLLSVLAQVALAAAALGWRVVAGYPKFLAWFAVTFDEKRFNVNTMPNLRGVVHELLGGKLPHTVLTDVTVALSGLLLLAAVLVLRCRNAAAQPEELRYSLVITSAFLASYHGFFHDATLLLLPLLLVWNWLALKIESTLQWRLLAAGVAVPFAGILIPMTAPQLLGPAFACAGLFFWGALLWNLSESKEENQLVPRSITASAALEAAEPRGRRDASYSFKLEPAGFAES